MEPTSFIFLKTYRLVGEYDNGHVFHTLGEMADWLRITNYEGSAEQTLRAEPIYQITSVRFHPNGMEVEQTMGRLNRPDPWEWCGPNEYDEDDMPTPESQSNEDRWMSAYTNTLCDHFGIRDISERCDDFGRIAREEMWLTPETAAVEYMRSINRLPDNW